MSEVFDPEKVSRFIRSGMHGMKRQEHGLYVLASDYDQLLALYREATTALGETLPHLQYKLTHTQTSPAMKAVSRTIDRVRAAIHNSDGRPPKQR